MGIYEQDYLLSRSSLEESLASDSPRGIVVGSSFFFSGTPESVLDLVNRYPELERDRPSDIDIIVPLKYGDFYGRYLKYIVCLSNFHLLEMDSDVNVEIGRRVSFLFEGRKDRGIGELFEKYHIVEDLMQFLPQGGEVLDRFFAAYDVHEVEWVLRGMDLDFLDATSTAIMKLPYIRDGNPILPAREKDWKDIDRILFASQYGVGFDRERFVEGARRLVGENYREVLEENLEYVTLL